MDLTVIIFILIAITAGVAVYLVAQQKTQEIDTVSLEALNQRIAFLQEGLSSQGLLEARTDERTFLEKVSSGLVELFGNFAPTPNADKLALLSKAGLRTQEAYFIVFATQISLALAGGIIGFFLGMLNSFELGLLCSFTFGFLAFRSVWSNIRRTIKQRSYLIDKTLPDTIDLFANCCAAGVSFDSGANYILSDIGKDESMRPIKEDLLAWQADTNLGMARPEAWRRLAERSDSKNMRYFTSLMDQSEKTGGSVSEALLKMSGFFRERRRQMLEAEIAQLPTKMNMQTMIFIVMPTILLIMCPIVLKVFVSVTALGK